MTSNHLLLYRLAELMLENEQHMLPVDLLFDDEQIGDFVKSIQIDSPYQQMLLEGVLTESVRNEMLYVSFTVEGYFHYVLGEVVSNHFYREGALGLRYIVDLMEHSSFSHAEQAASQFFLNEVNHGALTFIHSLIEHDFDSKGILTPALVQSLLLNSNENYLFKIDHEKLWGEVLQKLIQISKYELASKCIATLDINVSKNLLSPDLIPHLNNELLESLQNKLRKADSNFALEFYLGRYENLTTQFNNRENQALIPEIDLLYVASAFIDTGKNENAIAILNRNNYSENSFIERHRLQSIAFNGLSLNNEAIESISVAIKKAHEQYGQYHFKTAELINLKGLYSLIKSEFQEAIDCFNRCAKIYKNIKGEDNFEFATAINNMALVMYHKDDFQSAIENWEQAIAILSSLGMRSHPEAANIHKSLALCHEKMGQIKNARYNIDTALNILNQNSLGNSEAALEYKQLLNRIYSNDI